MLIFSSSLIPMVFPSSVFFNIPHENWKLKNMEGLEMSYTIAAIDDHKNIKVD